jgi:electron transfer flavoprotein beta subunit
MINITVCIKQVPGTSDVEVDEKTGVLKRDGVDSKMNPFDLFALESALRLRQQQGGSISVITMGPPQATAIVHEAYMMGADDGAILSDRRFAGSDVLATSYTLSQGILKQGLPDLIICGKQTTDGDTAQVGPEIAEFLDIPHVTDIRRIIELTDTTITVEMDMSDTVEIAKIKLPALISVSKDIYQPRLPSFKLKLASKDRAVKVLTLDDFDDKDETHYGLNGSPTQVKRIFPPPSNDSHEMWEESGVDAAERLCEQLIEKKFVEII